MITNYAPVLIPTLNRFEHFQRCIESLAACTGADKTDLHIALDYPLNDSHWGGYKKIIGYIENIHGFKNVIIIRRTYNYGPEKNLFDSLDEVFEKYDRIIISEDDNIFSKDFLVFVNRGLEVYEKRNDIFSISGYQYPITFPPKFIDDVYIWMGFSAWGVGIWKNKWGEIEWNKDTALIKARKFLKNSKKVFRLNQIAKHYIPGLIHMIEINKLNADSYICMWLFINKLYSVFPTLSRVRNIGHDGSGVNCGTLIDDIYRNQEIYSGTEYYSLPFDIIPKNEMYAILKSHWKISFKSKIKIAAKLLFLNAGLYKHL